MPNSELTSTLPLCAFMTASTIAKPSPLPSPLARARDGSARKNLSKIRNWSSCESPGPLSLTEICTLESLCEIYTAILVPAGV